MDRRTVGLGFISVLTDELVIRIFSYLSAEELSSKIKLASHAFYIFCHEEDLWKNICLTKFGGDFEYKGSWKVTVMSKLTGKEIKSNGIFIEGRSVIQLARSHCPKDFILNTSTRDGTTQTYL
jgi:hypothetical protein